MIGPPHISGTRRDSSADEVSPPDECAPRELRLRRSTTLALVATLSVFGCSDSVRADLISPALPDTLRFRIEVGGSTDVSNELFYEEAFEDTTFLGRRLVSSPQTRYAGVMATSLEGTRGARTHSYAVRNDLAIGNRVRRDALGVVWRSRLSPEWRLDATPRIEYRWDRSFDRDLEQIAASGTARLRHTFLDPGTAAELGGRADFSRSSGTSAPFIPDRNAGGALLALERAALAGGDWRIEYAFNARAFPDSQLRDHYEHGIDTHWRNDWPAGSVWLEFGGERRVPIYAAPSTRDRFLEGRIAAEAQTPLSDDFALRLRTEGEALHYDSPDDSLYFDYQIARAALSLRMESAGCWMLGVGPRVEALFSRLDPGESYREIGGALDCEYLSAHSWWSVSPAAGWRQYEPVPSGSIGLHAPFAFYEVAAFADQSLAAALRARLSLSTRFEFHTDNSQDDRSLYFSLDVRRLF